MLSSASNHGSSMGSGGMGGFGGGDSFGEAADERSIMQQAMSSSSNKSSGAGSVPGAGGAGASAQNQPMAQPPAEPREVAEITEEAKRGVEDVWLEVKNFFSINTWLGIDPNNMSPEEESLAKQFHAKYQQLDQDQQAVAKQLYQEKIQRKRVQEDEERRKKEFEEDQADQSIAMPMGPQKGAQGGKQTKKQMVMTKIKKDRTTLSTNLGE